MDTKKRFLLSVPESTLIEIADAFGVPVDKVTSEHILEVLEEHIPVPRMYSREMFDRSIPFSHLSFDTKSSLARNCSSEERFEAIIRAGLWVLEQRMKGKETFTADSHGVVRQYVE